MGDEAIRQLFDRLSATYDRDRVDSFFEQALGHLEKLLADCRGAILEVGCGSGRYVAELRRRGSDVRGVDSSGRMCDAARARIAPTEPDPKTIIACSDVEEDLGFPGPFEAVVLMDCWEFFPQPERVLRNVHRALVENGRLIIFTPSAGARPLIGALEALRIKKLRPAFTYGNSSLRRVKQLTADRFELEQIRKIFFRLETIFVLRRRPADGANGS